MLRGGKLRIMEQMKENGEKKVEELFVSFMTNCPATGSLAWGQWGYLLPLILAASYWHLQ